MSRYNVEIFRSWQTKAEEDRASAEILLKHNGPPGTVCFLCQQMAEKYLKGFALLHEGPLKRIHNLGVLLKDCRGLEPSFEILTADALLLNQYYLPSRYADDIPEDISPEKAVAAFEAADRIREKTLAIFDLLLASSAADSI